MAVIGNSDLQTWGDKLARWGSEAVGDLALNPAFTAGWETASDNVLSGAGALSAFILALTDQDVVADLLPSARDLDETHPTPDSGFLLRLPEFSAAITAMNRHIVRYGDASGLDAYLTALNLSTPVLRFAGQFKDYFGTLSRGNAFVPEDTVLATFAATAATTGTFVNVATITRYAGAKLVIKNQGAVTTGATLTATVKTLAGATTTLTGTVSTGTDNTETNMSDTTKLYVDVTNITITGGTNTNIYEIVAKKDRSIAAA